MTTFDVMSVTMPFLLEGLWMTIQISLVTIISGSILGFFVGMARTVGGKAVSLTLGV